MKTKYIFLITLLCGIAVFMTVKADPETESDPDADADAKPSQSPVQPSSISSLVQMEVLLWLLLGPL